MKKEIAATESTLDMAAYKDIILEQLVKKILLPSIATTNEVMSLPIILNESG